MSHLVAIAYPTEDQASKVIDVLNDLAKKGVIELDDAVAVIKDDRGGIKFATVMAGAKRGAGLGAFWGSLIGLVFFMPVVGAAFGATTGALIGKLSGAARADSFGDFGLHIRDHMEDGSSAVLMLGRKTDPDAAIEALKPYGGTVMRTTLPDEVEAQLRSVLDSLAASES